MALREVPEGLGSITLCKSVRTANSTRLLMTEQSSASFGWMAVNLPWWGLGQTGDWALLKTTKVSFTRRLRSSHNSDSPPTKCGCWTQTLATPRCSRRGQADPLPSHMTVHKISFTCKMGLAYISSRKVQRPHGATPGVTSSRYIGE